MKKYFFTGFVTLLPLALTLIIAVWLFNLFTAPLAGIMQTIILSSEKQLGFSVENHEVLVALSSRILAFVFLLLLILFLGFCGQRFFVTLFFKLTERLFSHIPFFKTVFKISNEVTKAIFSGNKKAFKETVLIPFPHEDALALGFITGEAPAFAKAKVKLIDLAVFVPTAPHPMSGFILLTLKKEAIPVDVSVEDAFKYIISCGVAHPGERPSSHEKIPT